MVRFSSPRLAAAFFASALVCNVASAQEPPAASLREGAQSQALTSLPSIRINAAGLGLESAAHTGRAERRA